MSIQFNKVTWYSKTLAVFVLIATVIFSIYIRGEYEKIAVIRESIVSPGGAVSATGDVALDVGRSAIFDGLEIYFNGVVKDDRCPVDVRCIRAGDVTAKVTLRAAGIVQTTNLLSDGIIYRFANYAVSIKNVVPARNSQIKIGPQNYIVVFHVVNILRS